MAQASPPRLCERERLQARRECARPGGLSLTRWPPPSSRPEYMLIVCGSTLCASLCYGRSAMMAYGKTRINVSLDPEYAEKLAVLAERAHLQEGTLARSLLLQAIDDADLDARTVVDILDGIPGAFERAERGIEQIRAGKGIPLDEL